MNWLEELDKKNKLNNVPSVIKSKNNIFSFDIHPTDNKIVCGQDNGKIKLFDVSIEENKLLNTYKYHNGSVRDIIFNDDGKSFFSVSSDKSIKSLPLNSNKGWNIKDAHE